MKKRYGKKAWTKTPYCKPYYHELFLSKIHAASIALVAQSRIAALSASGVPSQPQIAQITIETAAEVANTLNAPIKKWRASK